MNDDRDRGYRAGGASDRGGAPAIRAAPGRRTPLGESGRANRARFDGGAGGTGGGGELGGAADRAFAPSDGRLHRRRRRPRTLCRRRRGGAGGTAARQRQHAARYVPRPRRRARRQASGDRLRPAGLRLQRAAEERDLDAGSADGAVARGLHPARNRTTGSVRPLLGRAAGRHLRSASSRGHSRRRRRIGLLLSEPQVGCRDGRPERRAGHRTDLSQHDLAGDERHHGTSGAAPSVQSQSRSAHLRRVPGQPYAAARGHSSGWRGRHDVARLGGANEPALRRESARRW